ncbi:MAG TPA: hypothetical protein VMS71_02730, partial [Candidatus Acidoferrum sp.]|nr:hypothetical protein [Candidatus Acidoferrum sp.]
MVHTSQYDSCTDVSMRVTLKGADMVKKNSAAHADGADNQPASTSRLLIHLEVHLIGHPARDRTAVLNTGFELVL